MIFKIPHSWNSLEFPLLYTHFQIPIFPISFSFLNFHHIWCLDRFRSFMIVSSFSLMNFRFVARKYIQMKSYLIFFKRPFHFNPINKKTKTTKLIEQHNKIGENIIIRNLKVKKILINFATKWKLSSRINMGMNTRLKIFQSNFHLTAENY